jgi:NAD(P)-dependent dehydrogenase (short-subunit alcohol dehydrogenase family)
MDYRGKTVVVTGGASGIGQGLVIELAKRGANVATGDLNQNGLEDTLEMAKAEADEGQSLKGYALDVSEENAWPVFSQAVLKDFGAVDGIINNAGIALTGSAQAMSHAELRRVMDVNFYGMVFGSQAFMDDLQSRPEAFIANVSSVFGLFGVPDQAAYCASKFAIRGYTESLREDLKDSTIHVASIHPGHIGTRIVTHSTDVSDGSFWHDKGISQQEAGKRFRELGMPPARAARIILDGIKAGKARILVGRDAGYMQTVLRLAPVRGVRWINAMIDKIHKKQIGLDS